MDRPQFRSNQITCRLEENSAPMSAEEDPDAAVLQISCRLEENSAPMSAEEDPDAAVLSDVDADEEDPIPISLPTPTPTHSVADLLAELEQERQARKAAEDARGDLQNSFNRLKVLAREAINKRDEAIRDKEEALRSVDRVSADLSDAKKDREEATRKAEASRGEIETASKMLVTGIGKISSKVGSFKKYSTGGLPRSEKYTTGLPAVAYGVIKRADQIAEEMIAQVEASGKARDQAREQVEQRNYEIAIEVSQLEATIAGTREEVERRGKEIERLEIGVKERDVRLGDLDRELAETRRSGEESEEKARSLQARLDSQRTLVIEQLNYISRAHDQVLEIAKNADLCKSGQSELVESTFMWKEMDVDENLRTALEGNSSLCGLLKVSAGKVKECIAQRNQEVDDLNGTLSHLVAQKKHIGILLRSALTSKTSDMSRVTEDGLREAGIDVKFDAKKKIDQGADVGEIDEVYSLAGALEDTVKASQIEIVELQHLVEALRLEVSLLKAHLDAQAKEIAQHKHQIKELEEKERVANENVEGLMIDIAAAEEEIARWKTAAEQEAAAGVSIEQEFMAQMTALQRQLDEAKQAVLESENKIKFKEETTAAAMVAREAAEKSLRLADLRSTRLRERVEELTRQLEELDNCHRSSVRYACWPWQWLGLNYVGYQTDVHESSNEMELSEPLI